jgi:cardiolipin synthase
VARAPLTFRRLSGLDRSGSPPPETLKGAPLRPWTIPNAIGYVRIALIPTFLAIAFSDADGQSTAAAVVFGVVGWSDYADGIAARITGQYSRLGALMDPFIDRLLVVSGVVVCWHFDLLPHWALLALGARELITLGLVQWGVRKGFDLNINWWGRWGVWPAMSAPFFAVAGAETLGEVCLYVGLLLTWVATAYYLRDGIRAVKSQPST